MTIRRATVADLDALLILIEEFYEVDPHPFDRDHIVPALVPMLQDDALGQVWLLDDGGPDGYTVVTWSWSLESGGRDCILDEIYVRHGGRGDGGRLLAHAIRAAEEFGARSMFLESEAPNERARRFYQRHGFQIEDSTWMSAWLSPGIR